MSMAVVDGSWSKVKVAASDRRKSSFPFSFSLSLSPPRAFDCASSEIAHRDPRWRPVARSKASDGLQVEAEAEAIAIAVAIGLHLLLAKPSLELASVHSVLASLFLCLARLGVYLDTGRRQLAPSSANIEPSLWLDSTRLEPRLSPQSLYNHYCCYHYHLESYQSKAFQWLAEISAKATSATKPASPKSQ